MSERFFVDFPISGHLARLTGQELQHLTKVLRARIGDEIILFDGHGAEYLARITNFDRHSAACEILDVREIHREPVRPITVGVALPKGDRQRFLVEKLTELGATCLSPLLTRRSVVHPDEQTVDRLRRFVIEASKQCGRNRLMQIAPPQTWSEFLTADGSNAWRWIAHPGAESGLSLGELSAEPTRGVSVAIGPEGGFTDEEVTEAVDAGWSPINLGSRVLRVETAAINLVAIAALSLAGERPPAIPGTPRTRG